MIIKIDSKKALKQIIIQCVLISSAIIIASLYLMFFLSVFYFFGFIGFGWSVLVIIFYMYLSSIQSIQELKCKKNT